MRFCPEISELQQKGVIKMGANNQWTMADGTALYRSYLGEPLVDIVERIQTSSTNLVTIEEEEDEEDEAVYAVQYPVRTDYDFFKESASC